MTEEEDLQATREGLLRSLRELTTKEDRRVEAQTQYIFTLDGRYRSEVVADFNESEEQWVKAFREQTK